LYGVSGSVILAVAGAIYLWRGKKMCARWIYPVLLFASITLPQIVIHAKSGIIDRYLIPATLGCSFFSIFIYREIKINDREVKSGFWKNLSLALGSIICAGSMVIVFSKTVQQSIIDFAFHMQGRILQEITAVSSMQYLAKTIFIIGITGILVGIILLGWGFYRSKLRTVKISQLYMSGLLLVFVLNLGMAFASCRRYAMRGYATEGFLKTVVNSSSPDDVILVAGCPLIEGEGLGTGFATYMRKYNRANLFIYPLTRNVDEDAPGRELVRYYDNKDIDAIGDRKNIQVIAIFSGQEEPFRENAEWFDPSQYSRYEFAGNYVVYAKK
jgi:hypothetical protein